MTQLEILTDFFELLKMALVFGFVIGVLVVAIREMLNF
jgi:hypothetical protein